MTELLTNLGYVTENPIEDESFNNLLNSMWLILSLNQENYHEPGVTERNLLIFIQAIENIYLDNMICSYPLATKEPRAIGFMINDLYYIESEQDIKRIHMSF